MESRLPAPKLDHLARLTDDVGIFEHAARLEPRREHGYTTEDAARALVVTARWQPDTDTATTLSRTYLTFIRGSIVEGETVRNRMSPDRDWVGPPSADAHGRTIWGLCLAAAESASEEIVDAALSCLDRLWTVDDPSIRPWVYTGLGATALLRSDPTNRWARALADEALRRLPEPHGSGWIWPESRLTYDNARLPQCLIGLGVTLERPETVKDGLSLLTWLVGLERDQDRFSFASVGGRGPGDTKPAFDQQPLEATAMADACVAAWEATGDESWHELALQAVGWFLGRNDLGAGSVDRGARP